MFSVFNFSSISRGSVDPICPYVRTPMSRPRCLLSAFRLRKNFLPLWDQQFPSIMRNGSKLRRTVVISLCHFTLVTLFVVFIGTPAAWPDTPGTVLEMTASRFLHSRSFPFPSSSLIPIPLGIPFPRGITSNFSSRAFSASAPSTWKLELSTCTHSFYRHPVHL